MLTSKIRFAPVALLALAVVSALGQETYDARDMFYSAADMVGSKKKPAEAQSANSKPTPAREERGGSDGGHKGTAEPANRPLPEMARRHAVPKDPEAHFQAVSEQNLALGLRYSVLKQTPAGLTEVPPDSAFHAGDAIRISVMGNQKGYLYVIARGSSGVWSPLFPHPESSQRRNEIVPGRKYQVPGGAGESFTFDEQAGEEKVFIMLSKEPVRDMDSMILALSQAGAQRPKPEEYRAQNRLDDQAVDRFRNDEQARDLVFTKAGNVSGKGEQEDKGSYVVNPNSVHQSGSRVVVDLTLNHQ